MLQNYRDKLFAAEICLYELVVFAPRELLDIAKWQDTKILKKNFYEIEN